MQNSIFSSQNNQKQSLFLAFFSLLTKNEQGILKATISLHNS